MWRAAYNSSRRAFTATWPIQHGLFKLGCIVMDQRVVHPMKEHLVSELTTSIDRDAPEDAPARVLEDAPASGATSAKAAPVDSSAPAPPEERTSAVNLDMEPYRLLVFGDSWAHMNDETDPGPSIPTTWPELLGVSLGWATLNLAVAGSGVKDLDAQADRLLAHLAASGRAVHEDAWVLIHTGGNDILTDGFGADAVCFTCQSIFACCGCTPRVCRGVANQILVLAERLHATLKLRQLILVGVPFSRKIPMLTQLVDFLGENLAFLLGAPKCMNCCFASLPKLALCFIGRCGGVVHLVAM